MTDESSNSTWGVRLMEAGRWVASLLLWVAGVLAAACLGGPLGLFGLSGLALLVSLLLVVVAASVWRRAALPLCLAAGALSLSAAAVAERPARVDRSHGLLLVMPKTSRDLAPAYRRGLGDVVIDLRDYRWPDGQSTRITARSDAGNVVVALPRDRCVRLTVIARPVPVLAVGLAGLALTPVTSSGVVPPNAEFFASDQQSSYGLPPLDGQPYAPPSSLIAYGRSVPDHERVFAGARTRGLNAVTLLRPVDRVGAPDLQLDLTAGRQIYVRDYPKAVGVAFRAWEQGGWGEQVGDTSWPGPVQLPRSPGELQFRDRWRLRWEGHEDVRRRWARWYPQFVAAAKAQALRAAGACAIQQTRAGYWGSVALGSTFSAQRSTWRRDSWWLAVSGTNERRLVQATEVGTPDGQATRRVRTRLLAGNPFDADAPTMRLAKESR